MDLVRERETAGQREKAWPGRRRLLALLAFAWFAPGAVAEPEVLDLWPGVPPDGVPEGREQDVSTPDSRQVAGRPVIRLKHVFLPQLAVYRPEPEEANGAAVIVCPGGGHNILAYDLEGTEVAEWLAGLGFTGIVLKYRVPAIDPDRRWKHAVQDAQRAVSVVRSRAAEWKLDPGRIGILGFSAGGQTAGYAALLGDEKTYGSVDPADELSSRPDFAVLVYPAYFVPRKDTELTGEARGLISEAAPPMFLVHASDDGVPCWNSLRLFAELKKRGVPAELHIFAEGGHGYGLRKTEQAVTRWPELCARWLRRFAK